MTIKMNEGTKVELSADEVKYTADKIEMAAVPGTPLTEKIQLSSRNQNQFAFITLLSNLEAYIAGAITKLDPNVTNETIDLLLNDIKSTSGLVTMLNTEVDQPSSDLSTVFFGKRTVPSLFLDSEFSNQDLDDQNSIPFAHYLQLRNERHALSLQPFGGMPYVPLCFVVTDKATGYHSVKFIGYADAFERAADIIRKGGDYFVCQMHRPFNTPQGPGPAFGRYQGFTGQAAGGLVPQRFSGEADPSSQF